MSTNIVIQTWLARANVKLTLTEESRNTGHFFDQKVATWWQIKVEHSDGTWTREVYNTEKLGISEMRRLARWYGKNNIDI